MQTSNRITWTPRPIPKGWVGPIVVPAVIKKEGSKRVLIEFVKPGGLGELDTCVQRWVDRASLTPRVLPCAALKEPLEWVESGFELSATQPDLRGWKVFPDGVYYGTVDGYPITAPVPTAEHAVHQAYHLLRNGTYESALLSAIDYYQRRMERNPENAANNGTLAELNLLRDRLQKVQAAGFVRTPPPTE